METAVTTGKTNFAIAKTVIAGYDNISDKATAVETQVGFDFCFALLANGASDQDLASRLGLTLSEFKLIITMSPELRARYIEAKTFRLAESSVDILDEYSSVTALSKEEKSAIDMHTNNIERVIKVSKSKDDEGNKKDVLVQNVVVVRSNDDIPPVPVELASVIDPTMLE